MFLNSNFYHLKIKLNLNQNNWSSTIMSIVISAFIFHLLFCQGVVESRPQSSSSSTHVNYFMDELSLPESGPSQYETNNIYKERAEDDHESRAKQQDLEKLRQVILGELGLTEAAKNASAILPKEEISREEYIRAYTEYMSNVQKRKRAENALLSASHKERRRNYKRTVQFFDNLVKDTNPTTFNSHNKTFQRQLMFDVNFSRYYNTESVRVTKATLYLPTGCFLPESMDGNKKQLDQLDITSNVTYWINHYEIYQHLPLKLTAECNSSNANVNSTGYVKVIAKLASKESLKSNSRTRRERRSIGAAAGTIRGYLNRGKGRDCDKTRHGKTCCRRPLKVDFNDLNIKDLILEPKQFDAYMCSGRCNARRVPFASTHAMFQQTLHQTLGKAAVPRPCCTPTELQSLDVIHTVPGEHRLEVTVLRDAVVLQCGCS